MIAVNADAALLCVNENDDIYYIKRTIDVIEGMTQTKVLCLIVFPFEFNNNWRGLTEKVTRISQKRLEDSSAKMMSLFKLPVFILDKKSDILQVGDLIINFLSREE